MQYLVRLEGFEPPTLGSVGLGQDVQDSWSQCDRRLRFLGGRILSTNSPQEFFQFGTSELTGMMVPRPLRATGGVFEC